MKFMCWLLTFCFNQLTARLFAEASYALHEQPLPLIPDALTSLAQVCLPYL